MADNNQPRITLTLEGSRTDQGHVRLSDLVEELEALKEALRQTERSMFANEPNQVYYRIVDASHSSPLKLVLEPVPVRPDRTSRARAKRVTSAFVGSMRQIKKRKRPDNADLPMLESFRDLGNTLGKNVERIEISDSRGKVIPIDRAFQERISDVIGPDEFAIGSISGKLEKLNLHNTSRFEIFPTIGPKRVVCIFDEKDLEDVRKAVKRYVTVTGRIRYKQWAEFPHAIDMKHLDIHEMEADLPSINDIRGIAPNASNGLRSEDFVRQVRDEEW